MAPTEEEKRELVNVFLEVTHSSDEGQAAQMLEWYGWKVDQAVNAFMLGDTSPPSSYLHPTTTSSPVIDEIGLASGFGGGDGSIYRGGGDPIGGVGHEDHGRRGQGPSAPDMLSVVIGIPFRLVGKVMSYMLAPINYILGVEDQPKDGGAAARRFVNKFEAEYGRESRPAFVTESYKDAVQEAARQHKFLLVYLHAPLHQDTPQFCRSTLCSTAMVDFMEHNILVWGGSLTHGEAFAVGNSLGVCAFPYVGLLLCKRNQVQVVERVEGVENTEGLLDRLTAAMARFQEQLDMVFRQQRERDEARRLREEQDNEYKRGLEADRRRQEQQQESRRAKEKEAEDARLLAEERAAQKAREEQDRAERVSLLRQKIRDEPPAGGSAARIRMQLPNGSKVDRRFEQESTVGDVKAFLTIYLEDNSIPISNFSLSTNFPRKTYGEDDDGLSMVEAGLHPQALLFVHDLDA